jgi:hypothetical protein
MAEPSFKNRKQLRFVITLKTGTFGSSQNNVITLNNYRCEVEVTRKGGEIADLEAEIYGLKLEDMNTLTVVRYTPSSQMNIIVEVFAIDGLQESSIFYGWIVDSRANFNSAPDVSLYIQAVEGLAPRIQSVPPVTYQNAVTFRTVMESIVKRMGYNYESNNVNFLIPPGLYLAGTGLDQAIELANNYNIDYYLDGKTFAVTNKDEPRGSLATFITPNNGLIGYPSFDAFGVNFKTLYNPEIKFGGQIALKTSIKRAEGFWRVISVKHSLESRTSQGNWFSTVKATKISLGTENNVQPNQ